MKLHPKQVEIVTDPHRFRVVCAGRRGGKTELAVNEMVGKAYAKGGRSIAYIAPTLQQARDIAWVKLVTLCAPITVKKLESPSHVLTVQTQDGGKSTISLKGWEAVDTLRGQAFDLLVIDEIASMRNWDANWNTVLRPTLTDREGEALFISTPKGFNHFHDLYNQSLDPIKGKDYASFHFTSYDNPYLKPEEIEKQKLELSEDEFAQEYLADFRKQEGLVYKDFDRKRHIYDGDIPGRIHYDFAGVDFGFVNPAGVAHIKENYDSHFYVYKELKKTGMTDARVADYVASQRFNMVYPDPESAGGIKELTDRGVNVREVKKGGGSIVDGIQKVRELLKQNRLHIHSSCTELISEFETYHYPPSSKLDRNEKENPEKDNDHLLDALRYALMTKLASERKSSTHFIPRGMSANRGYRAPK